MVKSYAEGDDQKSVVTAQPQKQYFPVSSWMLTKMVLFFFTRNASATKRTRMKIRRFLNAIDTAQYANSEETLSKLALLTVVVKAHYDNGADSLSAVEQYLVDDTDWWDYHYGFIEAYRAGQGHHVEGELIQNELSDEDVTQVDGYVSAKLQFHYLWQASPWMREAADRIEADTLGDVRKFTTDFLHQAEALVQVARQAQAIDQYEKLDFHTGEDSFRDAVSKAHAERNRPQSKVRTGVGRMNEMFQGGYEGSRVYVHFGRAGDWKSGMLLNAALWACDPVHNPSFITRDPTRTPCVLYVTQENDYVETIERIISQRLGSNVDLKSYTDPDALTDLLEESFAGSLCKFAFRYRPSRSISTADIDHMIYEEWTQKREVIMVVHDYIKRIKSVETFDGARHLELGAVVDEESTISKRYGIPFLTGMQLTRDAYDKFSTHANKGGSLEALLSMGAQHVGESLMVFENADAVVFQSREFPNSVDEAYLVQRLIKMRGKRGDGNQYFAQPFAKNSDGGINEMKLVEDGHLPESEWVGIKDLRNGIAGAYDPNSGNGAPLAQQPVRAGRPGSTVSGAGGPPKGPPRRAAAPPRKRQTPEQAARDAIPGVVPQSEDGSAPAARGLEGLEETA